MIYAASVIATHHETKEVEHLLFSFTTRPSAELTPEQNATQIALDLLKEGELYDCRLKVIAINLSDHLAHHVVEEMQEPDQESGQEPDQEA